MMMMVPAPKIDCDVLSNGMRAVTIALPHQHLVSIAVQVRAGPRFETPETYGISHFVEHMLYRGNHRHRDARSIHHGAARLGGCLDASTRAETVTFEIEVLPDAVDAALKLLGALFTSPRFSDIETERAIVLRELDMYVQENGQPRGSDTIARLLLFHGGSLFQCPVGQRDNVARFGIEDLRHHFQSHYTAMNMAVSVAGPIERATVLASAEGHFGHLPPGSYLDGHWRWPPRHPRPYAAHLLTPGRDTDIYVMFDVRPTTEREEVALTALQMILGSGMYSLLYHEIVETRGLAYAVWASVFPYVHLTLFELRCSTREERAIETLSWMLRVLARVLRGGYSLEQALELVRRRYRAWVLGWLDTGAGLADWLGERAVHFQNLPDLPRRVELMEALSADDVDAMATRVLASERAGVVMVGALGSEGRVDLRRCTREWFDEFQRIIQHGNGRGGPGGWTF